MRIALDAMGGDFAPQITVEGAYLYQKETQKRNEVILVGEKQIVERKLEKFGKPADLNISVVHASQQIGMNESPTSALKQKKDSSLLVGIDLHKKGEADAFVSAGNTGAQMAASLLKLGRIPGVNRPALGSIVPSDKGVVLLIDVGANADCKPLNLMQFGLMGSIYFDYIVGTKDISIGLLNIGEESSKGNELSQASFKLMQKTLRNFVGNVEGHDILRGKVDIVVCDGFVGNIILKFAESVLGVISRNFRKKLGSNIFFNLGALLVRPAFSEIKRSYDYEEYGGVPLLGVNGISVICHGSSSAKAIKNALKVAEQMSVKSVNEHIAHRLHKIDGGS